MVLASFFCAPRNKHCVCAVLSMRGGHFACRLVQCYTLYDSITSAPIVQQCVKESLVVIDIWFALSKQQTLWSLFPPKGSVGGAT
mmetsp:Transcript_33983/g.78344  ORF Transcript_33983/g.78344 Transcript_33983/m.78344 type:complete len:85 (-) Transcript_33983:190-444(-)